MTSKAHISLVSIVFVLDIPFRKRLKRKQPAEIRVIVFGIFYVLLFYKYLEKSVGKQLTSSVKLYSSDCWVIIACVGTT